jgi:hypothetical protein
MTVNVLFSRFASKENVTELLLARISLVVGEYVLNIQSTPNITFFFSRKWHCRVQTLVSNVAISLAL